MSRTPRPSADPGGIQRTSAAVDASGIAPLISQWDDGTSEKSFAGRAMVPPQEWRTQDRRNRA
jgi:hypothetical protein